MSRAERERERTDLCSSRIIYHPRVCRHNALSLYLLRCQRDSVWDCGSENGRTAAFREVDAIPRRNRLDNDALAYRVGTWGAARYFVVELTIVYEIDDQDTVVWRTGICGDHL